MNKKELISIVKEIGEYTTNAEAEKALSAVTGAIESALILGDGVSIPGFGNFKKAVQKGKSGKVPGTDKTYTTQDKNVAKFKAAKALADKVAQ